MKIDIDINKLTLGEMKAFEKAGGDFERPHSAFSLAAFVFIYMKRENPAITMADVDALNINDLELNNEGTPGKLDPKATENSGS